MPVCTARIRKGLADGFLELRVPVRASEPIPVVVER